MRSAWLGVLLLLSACASTSGSVADGTDGTATQPTADQPTANSMSPATSVATDDAVTAPDDTATDPAASAASATATTSPPVVPEGFATTQAVVTTADGTTCEVCVWLAETGQQRAQGLMLVTDLGPASAMAFRYPDPHTGTFWMKDTLMPLSIAFFAPDGAFLDSFDMDPCTTSSCPNYPTATDFLVAVEVPQGELGGLGLVAGSRFELLDVPCVD